MTDDDDDYNNDVTTLVDDRKATRTTTTTTSEQGAVSVLVDLVQDATRRRRRRTKYDEAVKRTKQELTTTTRRPLVCVGLEPHTKGGTKKSINGRRGWTANWRCTQKGMKHKVQHLTVEVCDVLLISDVRCQNRRLISQRLHVPSSRPAHT